MITDLAGLSGLWVGLVKSRPNLEYVSFDHGFCDLFIKDPSKQSKAENNGNIWARRPPPLSGLEEYLVGEANDCFRARKVRWIPPLMPCCLCNLGLATDPARIHLQIPEMGGLTGFYPGHEDSKGAWYSANGGIYHLPTGRPWWGRGWLLPLAHLSFRFTSLLPMS